MGYKKKTWKDREVIYADDLNNMEEGIAEANSKAAAAKTVASNAEAQAAAAKTAASNAEAQAEAAAKTAATANQLVPEFANSIAECTDTSRLYVLPDGYIYAYTSEWVNTGHAFVPADYEDRILDLEDKVANLEEENTIGQAESVEWLKEHGDINRLYVLPDGCVYGGIPTETRTDEVSTCKKNYLPLAVDSDGNTYIGTNGEKGYKTGYRVSSSGSEKEAEGYECTGFIPAVIGDTIRIKNITPITETNDPTRYCTAYFFRSDYSKLTATIYIDSLIQDEGGAYILTIPSYDNIAYVRLTLKGTNPNTIITVNEEIITKTVTTVLSSEWNVVDDDKNKIAEQALQINDINNRIKELKLLPERAESLEWLKANGDTSKAYVLPDGYIYAFTWGSSMGAAYTNVLDNTEKQLNMRWSYSNKTVSANTGHMTTGYIPVKVGDVIRVNLPLTAENFTHDYNRVHYFDADGKYVAGHVDGAPNSRFVLTAESENVTSWVVGYECATNGDDTTNAKLSGADNIASMNWIYKVSSSEITEADISGLIMTINEPIEETMIECYAWRSTGLAFIIEGQSGTQSGGTVNSTDISEKAALTRIANWKYPIHEDAPVFLLEENKPAISADEQNTTAVYAKYDALMNANPDFITKVNCGMASDGTTPIYVYHFKESEPHFASKLWSETKAALLICSGVHPTEQAGVHSLYHAMEEITTNPKLRDLRRNVHFIVMPMINPTGFTDSTYGVRNPDGIQVHYNFEVDFKYPTDSGYVAHGNRNHGGETPLSIPETQYFDALMNQYKDTLACVISCHNNDVDVNRGTGYVWCSCATHYMCNLGFRFIDKMSAAWREKYGEAFDEGVRWANEYALAKAAEGSSSLFNPSYVYEQPEWDYRVGMASISGSGGTEYKQALKYGVHGINVETCDRCMVLDRDFSKKRTSNVVTMGAETYINFFRTFMAAYDPKNKKDYAPNLPWGENK